MITSRETWRCDERPVSPIAGSSGRDESGTPRWSPSPYPPERGRGASPMRIVITEFMSLDGVVQAPGGPEALLFGRRTWQTMAAAWPERAGDPFADRMNAIPKYVVSKTLGDDHLTWNNTTRIPGDEAVARIRTLHETDGGDLSVMGSPTLVRTLLREGLVDELRLMIEPVILGGGKTIFPGDGALHTLELVSTVTSGT